MRDLPLASVRTGVGTLRLYPLRTMLATLGIIIGVASLVAVLALGDGIERYAREQIERTTSVQAISVVPRTSLTVDGQRFARQDYLRFTAADVQSLAEDLGDLAFTTLMLNGAILGDSSGQPQVISVVGTLPVTAQILELNVAKGSFFTGQDFADTARVAVLSSRLGAGRAIGDTISLGGVPLRVVGILASKGEHEERGLLVPLDLAPRLLPPSTVDRAPDLLVKSKRVEDVGVVQLRVEVWLARKDAAWRQKAEVQTAGERIRQTQQGMMIFKLTMGAITGISLLVGGIGIMNVLLASVVERTREIGIRKAIGARQTDIMFQFLAESVTVTGLGSVLGVLLGLAGAYGITALIRAQSQAQLYAGFSWGTIAVAALAAILVGLVFGSYPALRAARLSPIDAIRHE